MSTELIELRMQRDMARLECERLRDENARLKDLLDRAQEAIREEYRLRIGSRQPAAAQEREHG